MSRNETVRVRIAVSKGQAYNRVLLNVLEHFRYAGAGDYKWELDGKEVDINVAQTLVLDIYRPGYMKGQGWREQVLQRIRSFGDSAEIIQGR